MRCFLYLPDMLYPGLIFESSPFSLVMSQEWLLEAAHYSNITPPPHTCWCYFPGSGSTSVVLYQTVHHQYCRVTSHLTPATECSPSSSSYDRRWVILMVSVLALSFLQISDVAVYGAMNIPYFVSFVPRVWCHRILTQCFMIITLFWHREEVKLEELWICINLQLLFYWMNW